MSDVVAERLLHNVLYVLSAPGAIEALNQIYPFNDYCEGEIEQLVDDIKSKLKTERVGYALAP